ncbi:MAG: tetratricopeptide repeat protein, partial [Bacteroidales bacterium]|nr:tetratricopeptide repeat protein [Bacteroidales bacterium]
MIIEKRFTILFFLLFAVVKLFGTDSTGFARAIERLNTLEQEAFRESVDSILENLEKISDSQMKLMFIDHVFRITGQKDEIAHIRSLCYKALYSDAGCPELFSEAFGLAKKNKTLNWMQYVQDRWARYYLASRQYDSAMIHILRMKDMWPKDNRDAQYLNILHLLGDMYFNAGLYDMADSVYRDIHQHYLQQGPLDFWRPYVVMNNLGLIQLKYKNYPAALQWFKKSLASAEENLHQAYKINLMAYTKIKIAETYFFMDSMSQAIDFFSQAEAYPDHQIYDDAKQEMLFFKSRFLLRSGRAQVALETA